MNGPNASPAFQGDWLARIQELADKYHPEILYMDNGVNPWEYDAIKLRAAAYLFNRAREAGYETTLCTKQWAYLAGSVQTAEGMGGSPEWINPGAWQCDTSIGNSWGYITGLRVLDGAALVRQLITISSTSGNYMLNVAPMGDGRIPDDQQTSLLAMGEWLRAEMARLFMVRSRGSGPARDPAFRQRRPRSGEVGPPVWEFHIRQSAIILCRRRLPIFGSRPIKAISMRPAWYRRKTAMPASKSSLLLFGKVMQTLSV
jgi:alpha-L-fucosidase